MKKIISFLFIAIAMMCVLSSCSQEESVETVSKSKDEQFMNNLKTLRNNQERVLSNARTRTFNDLSDEEIDRMAEEIDSLFEAFIWANAEYLAETMPEWDLSEDEIDMLSLDEDALIAFMNEHFSNGFCEQMYMFLHTEDLPVTRSPISASPTAASYTPFELAVISNVEVVSKFDNSDLQLIDDNKVSCRKQYDLDMSACRDEYLANTLSYTISAACALGGAGAALGGFAGSFIPGLGTTAGAIQGGSLGTSAGGWAGHYIATKLLSACKKRAKSAYEGCNKK